MPSTEPLESPAPRPAGRLGKALMRLLMKSAAVTAVERLSDSFRLITLEGAALRDLPWIAGQKVQVAMGSAFVARTYTPIDWDSTAGWTRILGYAHGSGPGSAWVRGLKAGDRCEFFGPRSSLDTRRLSGPLAVFGDETSLGLACALYRQDRTRSVACHFEVRDMEECAGAIAQLGLPDAGLTARQDGDTHVLELAATLPALAKAGASFVLTGKAGTIQKLRQSLRQLGVASARVVSKAYWAPGKTGLD
ncbi:siderophore-interacting protein [Radicibacter daui]|uniref:siderophore-interacting protein n=1 Tax=Radicibacter daui TaxID=3064829 RepID=UPI0040469897